VGLRTLQLIEEAGYRTVQDLAREDPDRLAIRTGLGIKKARQVQQGAVYFLEHEAHQIESARAALASESMTGGAAPGMPLQARAGEE
ncbi:MAG TPA: helix-hairpin-helix domain-containing protein, partial [Kofleriaceae bacterium]|nr:helix-hairpin-helix domain-containing protein [Kofleriaceae bacterium]